MSGKVECEDCLRLVPADQAAWCPCGTMLCLECHKALHGGDAMESQ